MVRERGLPILLEESFDKPWFFLKQLAPVPAVVIPHLGGPERRLRRLESLRGLGPPPNLRRLLHADLPEIPDFLRITARVA